MRKILVTGGSGFIGTNLVRHFIQMDWNVINLDINPPVPEFWNHWKCVDLLDRKLLNEHIQEFSPEYVVHLAARTDLLGISIDDYKVNLEGTQNLIFVLNKLPNLKRVLFASTMLVCKPGYFPSSETDYLPSTIYGKSKVEMEKMIRNGNHNFDWVIIRPTSIWGPHFNEPYRNFFELIKNQKYFHFSKNSCTKTFGYVGNVIYQIENILFLHRDQVHSKTYYLGDYDPVNIKLLANEIAVELGTSIKEVPFFIIRFSALLGDFFKLVNIKFPITSFRLNNMITDNVIDLSETVKIIPKLPYSRIQGIRITLKWLRD